MSIGSKSSNFLWQDYWKSRNLKSRVIEAARTLYFAPLFAKVVQKYIKTGPVLEAGCGSAAISGIISRKYEVTAADNSSFAVKSASEKYNFPVIFADIRKLPFKDNSFELVFNQGVMEHFSQEEFRQIITEFMRVARKFVIIVPCNLSVFRVYNPFDPDQDFYSLKEMNEMLKGTCDFFKTSYIWASFGLSLVAYGGRSPGK